MIGLGGAGAGGGIWSDACGHLVRMNLCFCLETMNDMINRSGLCNSNDENGASETK